jgi:hypothetical protein
MAGTPDDLMPVEARAHLWTLKGPCVDLGEWVDGELITDDGGTPGRGPIAEYYSITLPETDWHERYPLFIKHDRGTYRLLGADADGNSVLLAEGSTIQAVTERWSWVLANTTTNVVSFARARRPV